jgi:hypothetical protein
LISRRCVQIGLVLAALLAPAASAEPFEIKVRGAKMRPGKVLAIGAWRTEADPTLGAAIAAFGPPSSQRKIGGRVGCGVRWKGVGVRAVFADFGGGVACNPQDGRVQEARAYGSSWRTARGLEIGDRARRLRRLYPRAERHRAGFWLVTAFSAIGTGGRYPVLRSLMEGGRVSAFHVEVGAAGD